MLTYLIGYIIESAPYYWLVKKNWKDAFINGAKFFGIFLAMTYLINLYFPFLWEIPSFFVYFLLMSIPYFVVLRYWHKPVFKGNRLYRIGFLYAVITVIISTILDYILLNMGLDIFSMMALVGG